MRKMSDGGERVLPRITDFNSPFWDGLKEGLFQTTRCLDCRSINFPPRSLCPSCFSDRYEWFRLSGNGTIYSYTEHHIVPRAYIDEVPYVTAMIDLEEGPRLLARIKGASYDELHIGQKVEVGFGPLNEGIFTYFFSPVEE